jgi:ArsR family transcriptional regulator
MKVLREAGLVYGEKYGYHMHYLPNQEAVDTLSEVFLKIRNQSKQLDSVPKICSCEFRETGEKQ